MKEIKELNKWRHIPHSRIGIHNTVKMSILPKLIYRFIAMPMKIPASYLCILTNWFQSLHEKTKESEKANTTLKGKKMEDRHFTQLMVLEQLDPHAKNWIQTQSLYTSQILTQTGHTPKGKMQN